MVAFCKELLCENNFMTVLAIFCCYDYGANASEAVQKIATYQKEYHECSSCVIICWIAKIYLSTNNSEKGLVTRTPPGPTSDVTKKTAEDAKKKEQ